MITYNQMVQFVAVARNHSITKAAEELFVAQPAISATIKKIESELSVTLFFYENKQMYLTEDGEKVYKIVSEILELYLQLDAFSQQKDGYSTIRKKAIAYYAAPCIHDYITPQLQLFDVFPQIHFSLYNCSTLDEFHSAVQVQENIFGIFHILEPYVSEVFSAFPECTVDIITTLPTTLIASYRNPSTLMQKNSITLDELKGLPLLRCLGSELSINQYLQNSDLSFCMDVSNATFVDTILQKKPALYTLGHNLYISQDRQKLISVPVIDLPQVNLILITKNNTENRDVFSRLSRILHSLYTR